MLLVIHNGYEYNNDKWKLVRVGCLHCDGRTREQKRRDRRVSVAKKMRKWMRYVMLCFVFCFLAGSGSKATEMGVGDEVEYLPDHFYQEDESENIETDSNAELRILFVGNSLVGKNSMGEIFERMAAAGGHQIQVETLWKSGCSWNQYASSGNQMGRKLRRLLKKGSWDYVVLQERSVRPVAGTSESRKAVRKLKKLIENSGAKMMFLETWAPNETHKVYKKLKRNGMKGITQKVFQQKVRSFYSSLSGKYGANVIWAGDAMEKAEGKFRLNVLMADGKHPSAEGSYLMACVCYETFFGEKAPEWDGSLKSAKAQKLRRIAMQTVRNS